MAGLTFLRVVGNDELARQEQEAAQRALQARQNQPVLLGLASYLRGCWDVAKLAKKPIEYKMLRALRQRNGEYEADKLQQIRSQVGVMRAINPLAVMQGGANPPPPLAFSPPTAQPPVYRPQAR